MMNGPHATKTVNDSCASWQRQVQVDVFVLLGSPAGDTGNEMQSALIEAKLSEAFKSGGAGADSACAALVGVGGSAGACFRFC